MAFVMAFRMASVMASVMAFRMAYRMAFHIALADRSPGMHRMAWMVRNELELGHNLMVKRNHRIKLDAERAAVHVVLVDQHHVVI